MIDGVGMKDKKIIILAYLQSQAVKQLYSNCMDVKQAKLIAQESSYWLRMNADIENKMKDYSICPDFNLTHPKDKIVPLKDARQVIRGKRSRLIYKS